MTEQYPKEKFYEIRFCNAYEEGPCWVLIGEEDGTNIPLIYTENNQATPTMYNLLNEEGFGERLLQALEEFNEEVPFARCILYAYFAETPQTGEQFKTNLEVIENYINEQTDLAI